MFNPSRDEVRQFFFGVWSKYMNKQPLEGLESTALEIILHHPEYHAILENPARYQEREWLPEHGESNPFLHLSLHLALEEQSAIDQPPGIRALLQQLAEKLRDEHAARHEALDCLAEMVWQAQRSQSMPDVTLYLDCLQRKAGD